jgi:two-component system NarL family sensor kinase
MQTSNSIMLLITISAVLILLLASLTITLLYLYQKRHLAYQHQINLLKLDFQKNLLETQIEIQEQTFQDISREIHDNISLSLTLAKLNLNTLDWLDIESTYNSVKSSTVIIGSAITDLSNLSKSMNPEVIRHLGLLKAVKNEVERVQQLAHMNIQYEVIGEPVFMDCEKELVIFRIIQEAFNNVLKHAKAYKVLLHLNYNADTLDILIKDDGIGFIKEQLTVQTDVTHSGINNMKTRAKLFGGNLLIDTQENKGTQILITVPYN